MHIYNHLGKVLVSDYLDQVYHSEYWWVIILIILIVVGRPSPVWDFHGFGSWTVQKRKSEVDINIHELILYALEFGCD